ncbi:glycosyl hydrolase family 8 [Nautilia sp.]
MKKLIFLFFFVFLYSYNPESFIKNDSFVVDPYNSYRVTSESQGYGMIYAYVMGNKELFDKIWSWTKTNMQRKDGLFVWRYNKKIIDYNNAIDGDMFIAYALIKGSLKWKNPVYFNEGIKIINEIKKYALNINCNEIFIPAHDGFVKNNGIEIFPSYYVPFIFSYFYKVTHQGVWKNLYEYSYSLTDKILSDKMFFSFFEKKLYTEDTVSMDAYRVILYRVLAKENISELKNSFKKINEFFNKKGYIPLIYRYNSTNQMKTESPYCVYRWFYILYGDKAYLNKYNSLKRNDKQNYFCTFLDFFLEKGIK